MNYFKKFLKIFTFIVSTSIILYSCSKKDDGTIGQFPSYFMQLFPTIKLANVNPQNLELVWETCKDVEGPVTYDLYIDSVFPPKLEAKNLTATNYILTRNLGYNKRYYWQVRAYDTDRNSVTTGHNIFTTRPVFVLGTFTDSRDNRVYKTIKIGTQTWMAENLQYRTGLTASDFSSCGGNSANDINFGLLYSKAAIQNGNIIPSGWHIPTKTEFDQLYTFFPTKLSSGAYYPTAPDELGVNGCGFNAVLAGMIQTNGVTTDFGSGCYIWDKETDGSYSVFPIKAAGGFSTYASTTEKYSVRCIMD